MRDKQKHLFVRDILQCSRLLVVLLSICCYGFVPFHILSVSHAAEHFESAAEHDNHEADHHEGHLPHAETDHSTGALASSNGKLQTMTFVCAFLTAQDISAIGQLDLGPVVWEKEIPPNESPPERFSPRGPPLA